MSATLTLDKEIAGLDRLIKDVGDITHHFQNDEARPVNVYNDDRDFEFTFLSEDHAWRWANANLSMLPSDFERYLD